MALVLKDRVRETATVVGTGDAALLGAVTGFQSFSVVGNTNTCYYAIADQSGGDWEVGIGTYSTTGPTLARTTVLASSNSGSKVSFTGGTKDVFLTYPSEKAVYLDAAGNLNVTTIDATNLEVTNINAQDGTAAIALAGSTGVATFSANPILNAATANGVAYLNGSKVLTTGSALVFDGSKLGIGGTPTNLLTVLHSGVNTDVIQLGDPTTISNSTGIYMRSTGEGRMTIANGGYFTWHDTGLGEQMRLTSTGLGIGTSSPGAKLEVANGNMLLSNNYSLASRNAANTTTISLISRNTSDQVVIDPDGYGLKMGFGGTLFLNGSGNLGLGVTPSAWGLGKAFEFGNGGSSLWGVTAGDIRLGVNYYYNGSNYIYKANGLAGWYRVAGAEHSWFTAPSGTAGNAISFTQAMTLDASGNLVVGSTGVVGKFTSYATSGYPIVANSNTNSIALGTNGIIVFGTTSLGSYADGGYDASSHFFKISGTERMRLDSSGNLGLGVTPSASSVPTVQSAYGMWSGNNETNIQANVYYNGGYKYINTAAAGRYQIQTGAHYWYTAPSGTAGDAISFTQAMTLDASGNLGVGTTSPAFRLDSRVAGTTAGNFQNTTATSTTPFGNVIVRLASNGSSADATLQFTDSVTYNAYIGAGGGNLYFASNNGTERMRIDSSGNLLVGTTTQNSNAGGLKLANVNGNLGQIAFSNNSGSADYVARFYWGSAPTLVGTITVSSTATAYNTSSDYRLKENIQPMQNALARNALLKPCTYSWKADGSTGEGFIAHELQAVCPDAVTGEKDAVDKDGKPVYQGVDTSFLVGHLVACIQELKAELDQLKAKVG